jgi:hypothetical protein
MQSYHLFSFFPFFLFFSMPRSALGPLCADPGSRGEGGRVRCTNVDFGGGPMGEYLRSKRWSRGRRNGLIDPRIFCATRRKETNLLLINYHEPGSSISVKSLHFVAVNQ